MNDLVGLVDWSRAQFALTAIYHWLFVPLTIGLALIVAVMESIYYRTGQARWKGITKFWMSLFGINFACGVATGLILEFEFGTNWSNYSWFVGDIFGAPLAIEGLLAFFMEATFVAVMFFGWNKVSRGFHLASTWLTALGVTLSALWILVANAWMQYPVGMEFDPDQMRNVMSDFGAVVLSPVAINKFFHTVFSGWTLGGAFVVGVSCWLLWRKRNERAAISSVKVGGWVGLVGLLLTLYTGHGSAVEVSRVQPMKLAAMEGLYRGEQGQGLVGFGLVNPDKEIGDDKPGVLCEVSIPHGLSFLANGDFDSFVPGIEDLIDGYEIERDGHTIVSLPYADRIEAGRVAQEALRDYGLARQTGDTAAMKVASKALAQNFEYFGYGYFDDPKDAVPPVGITFYAFRFMVIFGGALLLVFALALLRAYNRLPKLTAGCWVLWLGMLGLPMVWICSESGWVVAEVGRQPWVIQNLMPTIAGISDISAGSVQLTFWIFALIFTLLLAAEVSIMLRYIGRTSLKDIESPDAA